MAGRKFSSLVAYLGHGGFRLDRHEQLLRTDDSLIEFLGSEEIAAIEHTPKGIKAIAESTAHRLRLEMLVALQLCYRIEIRRGRDAALPYAIAFRDLVRDGGLDEDRIAELLLNDGAPNYDVAAALEKTRAFRWYREREAAATGP